jgi:hypothetical protein
MSSIAYIKGRLQVDPFEPFPITAINPDRQFWIEHRECAVVWENDQGVTIVDEHGEEHSILWSNLPEESVPTKMAQRIHCKRLPDN